MFVPPSQVKGNKESWDLRQRIMAGDFVLTDEHRQIIKAKLEALAGWYFVVLEFTTIVYRIFSSEPRAVWWMSIVHHIECLGLHPQKRGLETRDIWQVL